MKTKEETIKKEALSNGYNWNNIISQFNLTKEYIHLGAAQFLSSTPKPVREAIARHRKALDENPVFYTLDHEKKCMEEVRAAAARYLAIADPGNIAQTDSTTMGLGLIYSALNLQPGQEILTTENEHYSHLEAIMWATYRTGASYRKVPMYKELSKVTEDEMVEAIIKEIKANTRVIGMTWVHSSTGLKTPVGRIGEALALINKHRDAKSKILLVVDAVHGFGIEMETLPELGCDFFITGCHKWLYGPRGTGIVAATQEAWQCVSPVIPSFSDVMEIVAAGDKRPDKNSGREMTPGGFHTLEYRWALKEAFEFAESIGKKRIYDRVHELNRQCKEGLASMNHVRLHTPMDDNLSAGIISFEIKGMKTPEVIEAMKEKKIVATASPYQTSYARFTPGIINTSEDVEQAIRAVRSLK